MAVEAPAGREATRDGIGGDEMAPPWYGPMSLVELTLSCSALLVFGALIYLPHLLHGGLYTDDWSDAAAALYPPGGPGLLHAIEAFAQDISLSRPVVVVVLPLKYLVLGTHVKFLLASSIGLAILVAMLFYGILRVLAVPWYHSLTISALTLAFPWFDSTRIWETASLQTLAIAFAFAGFWLALIGLSRRSWAFHAGAGLLYLLSILTYEVTLPLIATAGIVYVLRAGWRDGRRRWGADLIVVLVAGVWNAAHTPKSVSSLSENLHHLREIVSRGGELLARTLYPAGVHVDSVAVLIVVGAIFAAGLAAYRFVPSTRATPGWNLGSWLSLGFAGVIVAALGWVTFIPADPYYTPSIFGVTNRVNGVAGFGLVLTAYAAAGIIGSLAGAIAGRRQASLAASLTVALGLGLGATYVHVLERHLGFWRSAYGLEEYGVGALQAAFPRLPHGTTVFAAGYPANVTLGVPVFGSTWDLKGMVQVTYEDNTLRAYPITEELGIQCRRRGIVAKAGEESMAVAPYGSARLLDLPTGRHITPRSQRQCAAVKPRFRPGPLYLGTTY